MPVIKKRILSSLIITLIKKDRLSGDSLIENVVDFVGD